MAEWGRALLGLDPRLRRPLDAAGVSGAGAFVGLVQDYDDWDSFLTELLPDGDAPEGAAGALAALLRVAQGMAARDARALASVSHAEIEVRAVVEARRKRLLPHVGGPGPAAAALPVAAGGKWPGKIRRCELPTAEPRRAAEDAKRARAVEVAAGFVTEAGLPLAAAAARSARPEEALRRVAQGRRYRTILKRTASWARARAYFLATFGTPWPTELAQAVDYLEELAAAGSPPSVLWAFFSALGFLERGGGVPPAAQLCRDPGLRACIEELVVELSANKGAPRRKAPRLPLAVVLAWEQAVMDIDRPAYDRMYAWWQCVRTWASLRFDDHRGLLPDGVQVTERGLTAVLTRTKTSGRDKKVEVLPVHIAPGAYLHFPGWIREGWRLWREVPFERDFFLVMPNEDRSATKRVEVGYADALGMTRAQMGEFVAVKIVGGDITAQGDQAMLHQTALAFWTEHSPRPTLASWVSCLASFPADWPDLLGRWGACKAEGYVRTHRRRVHLMQEAVALKFRTAVNPHAVFDEGALLDDLRAFMKRRGASEQQVLETATNLVTRGELEEGGVMEEPAGENPDHLCEGSDEEILPVEKISNHDQLQIDDLMGKFVVSISGSIRRLHKVGNCYRKPGTDYAKYEILGDHEPDEVLYNRRCAHCWGKSRPLPPSSPGRCSSSSSSSGTSSSE